MVLEPPPLSDRLELLLELIGTDWDLADRLYITLGARGYQRPAERFKVHDAELLKFWGGSLQLGKKGRTPVNSRSPELYPKAAVQAFTAALGPGRVGWKLHYAWLLKEVGHRGPYAVCAHARESPIPLSGLDQPGVVVDALSSRHTVHPERARNWCGRCKRWLAHTLSKYLREGYTWEPCEPQGLPSLETI